MVIASRNQQDVFDGLEGFSEVRARHRRASPTGPAVSLQAKGLLNLLGSAYHDLGEPAAVTLLWNETTRQVAIKPVAPTAAGAIPVRSSPGARLISGKSFFNAIGEPAKRRVVFEDVELRGGALIFSLDRGRELESAVGSRRTAAAN